jgi:hypothetical protein
MTKKIYSTDKNLNYGKRKRIIKATAEIKTNALKSTFSTWEKIVFDCKMGQKYGFQQA